MAVGDQELIGLGLRRWGGGGGSERELENREKCNELSAGFIFFMDLSYLRLHLLRKHQCVRFTGSHARMEKGIVRT